MRETKITGEKGVKVGPWTLHVSKAAGVAIQGRNSEQLTRAKFSDLMERTCKTELYRLHDLGTDMISSAREMELQGIIGTSKKVLEDAQAELEKLTAARQDGPEEVEVGALVRHGEGVVTGAPDA